MCKSAFFSLDLKVKFWRQSVAVGYPEISIKRVFGRGMHEFPDLQSFFSEQN